MGTHIEELMGPPSWEFSTEWVERTKRPLIYAWIRGNEVLYIGKGTLGLSRPLGPSHHRIGHMVSGDRLLAWIVPSREDAELVEAKLITEIQPKYNGPHGRGKLGKTRDMIRMENARRVQELREENARLKEKQRHIDAEVARGVQEVLHEAFLEECVRSIKARPRATTKPDEFTLDTLPRANDEKEQICEEAPGKHSQAWYEQRLKDVRSGAFYKVRTCNGR